MASKVKIDKKNKLGYFAIGIVNGKSDQNIGTLWRSAYSFKASFIFTINRRYEYQSSDVTRAWRHIPLYHYDNLEIFLKHIPYDCKIIAIENTENAKKIENFNHPIRAIYLLGAEDHGLDKSTLDKCHYTIILPGIHCLNVSVAGSIVMFDRYLKMR